MPDENERKPSSFSDADFEEFLKDTWGPTIYKEVRSRLKDVPSSPAIVPAQATARPDTDGKKPDETKPVPEAIRAEDLIGQHRAKEALEQVLAMARVNEERKKRKLAPLSVTLHAVFSGSPGTGKTTFARYYAQEVRKLGLLEKGHLVEVSRSDLIAEYMGQTASKTRKIFDSALGGVLFIDEAYSLKQGKDDNFGQECIDTLVKAMEDHRDRVILILAGYTDEMRQFLHLNTGLKSRIPNFIEFEDFLDEELLKIFEGFCRKAGVTVRDEDKAVALEQITRGRKGRSFGNAREARNVFERALARQSQRLSRQKLADLSTDSLTTFQRADIDGTEESTKATASGAEQLTSLVGLATVKAEIGRFGDRIRVSRLRNRSAAPAMHWAFLGNPGTGRRTVAQCLARSYRDLGVLASGHWVEADRAALVAGFVGQTAIKTQQKLEEALGGVLFLRGAHTLVHDSAGGDAYGEEAVNAIAAALDRHRGKIAVILAGPTAETERFLETQPALSSHFSRRLAFPDYSLDELSAIAGILVKREGMRLSSDAEKALRARLETERTAPDFDNASAVIRLLERAYESQASRLVRAGAAQPSADELAELRAEDFHVPS